MAASTLIVLAAGVWAALDLRPAYRELRAAEAAAARAQTALLEGEMQASNEAFASARDAFAAADGRLGRGVVRLLGVVPLVGRNLQVVEGLAEAGELVAGGGHRVTAAISALPGGTAGLAPRQGRLPVEQIAALAPALEAAAAQVQAADKLVAALPADLLVGPVDGARTAFVERLAEIRDPVRAGAALAAILPAYLGHEGERRYFFGAQNPAEARGTGGLIGAWTVLTVDRGQLRLGDFQTITTLTVQGDEAFDVEPPTQDYGDRYARFAAAGHGSNINMTPDFPTAAQALLNLYERQRGDALDGVVLADPYVFEALLQLTGPVEVPNVRRLDASTVVDFLTKEQWAEFPEDSTRKPVLGDVAQTTLQRFLDGGSGDPARSLRVLGEAAGKGHLLLHSTDEVEQSAFLAAGVAGAFAHDVNGAFLAVVINNAAANKLDYYLEQEIDYEIWLQESSDAFVRATILLHNAAPTSGPGTTVLGPNIDGLRAGDHRVYLSAYCGPACSLLSYRVDGRPSTIGSEREFGLAVAPTTIELKSKEFTELQFEWTQADVWNGQRFMLTTPRQAIPNPPRIRVKVHAPPGADIGVPSGAAGAQAEWEAGLDGTTLEVHRR